MNSVLFVALPLAALSGALMYLLPYITPWNSPTGSRGSGGGVCWLAWSL